MCRRYPCLNHVLCKILCVCLFCDTAEGVLSLQHGKSKVLMLMVLLCIYGQDGASEGRKLKFPEPGNYENSDYFEEVYTTEVDGYAGFIMSPGFPEDYIEDDNMHYLLIADEGQIIELVFEDPFDIEWSQDCVYDALIIRDGRYGYSPPLARVCGSNKPEPIISSGMYMSLLFKSDSDVNGIGFFANFTFIDAPETIKQGNISRKECHFNVGGTTPRTLSGFDGLIDSERGRKFFRDNANSIDAIDCTWEINMPEYYKIMIEFQTFDLIDKNECDSNKVEVYDLFSYDLKGRLLRRYCSTTAPTLMTISNRAFIRFVVANGTKGAATSFKVLYTAYRDAGGATDGCNTTVSFACAEFMCLDYSLRCNGRRNCWNFAYDELNCIKQENPHWTEKVDTVLGVTMGIILFVTLLTIVMTCRHSCLRTQEKAKIMAQRRKAEKQAVTYMMDNKEGGDSHEMTTLGEKYNTQYIKLSSEPHNGGYGQRPSLTPTSSSAPHMGMRAPPLTEYEKIMDGDAAYRDARAVPLPASSPWVYRDAAEHLRPSNDVQIHV